ncbi:MAG: uncharacterized protein V7637_5570, partial [Mycobacteriales bacterium]
MTTVTGQWAQRVENADWGAITTDLDRYGCALTGPLLSVDEAAGIAALYPDDSRFRSTVNMGRHRFGEGEYRNPGVDHTGGEFLLYEQRPRAQSRATATLIPHGHGLVFTTRDRPVA